MPHGPFTRKKNRDAKVTAQDVNSIYDALENTPTLADVGVTGSETTRWSANHDEGSLADWYAPSTSPNGSEWGGPFSNGGATATASTTYKRSGTHSAKLTIPASTPGGAGARLFRWGEPRLYREAYYEAYYYFPAVGVLSDDPSASFWQIMQFKSRNQAGTRNDPFWYIDIVNPTASTMRARLVWWGNQALGFGPHAAEAHHFRAYDQRVNPINIPVGQWVRFRMYLKQNSAGQFDGAIKVWQDDALILEQSNIITGYDNTTYGASWRTTNEWSVNNYSDGINRAQYSLYVDDPRIYTT